MPNVIYSDSHIAFLRSGYKKMGVADLTIAFNEEFVMNKTAGQIKSALSRNKIRAGRKTGNILKGTSIYTAEEKQWCIDNYPKMKREQLSIEFNKKFNRDFPESALVSFLKRNGITSNRSGKYEKGAKPWNEGTKGVMKSNKTSFKKGQKAHNHRQIGSERINVDGYIEIKIAEPGTWDLKHRVIWVEENGPINKDDIVRFKDGDKTNCEPSNLFLVDRATHAALNQMDLNGAPMECRDSIVLVAKIRSTASRLKIKQEK